jgi:hypothetical protein
MVGTLVSLPAAIKADVARRREGIQPPVTVTPAMLAATKEAALQVNPLSLGGSNFLKRSVQRRDGQPGIVEVWRTSENQQLFLRGGVLIGSRGLGGDILSSDVSSALSAFVSGMSKQGQRRYVISRGDHASGDIVLQCSYRFMGLGETLVVDQVYRTQHFREQCKAPNISISNDYWVQPESGTVRKSRQWAGPTVGYFEMILLKG